MMLFLTCAIQHSLHIFETDLVIALQKNKVPVLKHFEDSLARLINTLRRVLDFFSVATVGK